MTSMFVALAVAAAVSPSGHWEGTLETPQSSIAFQVDIAQVDGALAGAISIPQQHVKELPLTTIIMDGTSITFGARSDQLLSGDVDAAGTAIAGTYSAGPYSFPFTLKRTGDATIAPPPTSARVDSDLEGTWRGVLGDTAGELHLVLTMTNTPDGRAIATVVNEDEGGVRLPVVVSRQGRAVTIASHVVESSFTGELNARGEIVGTFHQGAAEIPLTFRR